LKGIQWPIPGRNECWLPAASQHREVVGIEVRSADETGVLCYLQGWQVRRTGTSHDRTRRALRLRHRNRLTRGFDGKSLPPHGRRESVIQVPALPSLEVKRAYPCDSHHRPGELNRPVSGPTLAPAPDESVHYKRALSARDGAPPGRCAFVRGSDWMATIAGASAEAIRRRSRRAVRRFAIGFGSGLDTPRLARSLTDARNIVEELTEGGVKLNIGGSLHDPTDPVGRLLFNVLGMIAEFESDLIRMRTREGMKVAKAKGRLRGKQPKRKPAQEAHLVELWRAGKHTSAELAELFSVARSTVYRAVQRAGDPKPARARKT